MTSARFLNPRILRQFISASMAQNFADNLFDVLPTGRDLRFADLNPARPNLVLNAANGTRVGFGEVFRFTEEQFRAINSDIES